MGRALENNLINLGLYDSMRLALADLGLDLDDLLEQEPDAGLGNGGLGRLAACFLDSMATLSHPGLRLRHPLRVRHLRPGDPQRLPGRAAGGVAALRQPLGDPAARGHRAGVASTGGPSTGPTSAAAIKVHWVDARHVLGMPYDMPIAGYRNDTVNTLRLWRARASQEFDLADFNAGDYLRRGRGQGPLREHLQGALPQRPHRDGQGAAAPAAVLLRRLRHPRHRPPLPQDPRRVPASSPTRSPSSSTTPTRPWPSPS